MRNTHLRQTLVKIALKFYMTLYVAKHFHHDFERFILKFSWLIFTFCIEVVEISSKILVEICRVFRAILKGDEQYGGKLKTKFHEHFTR